MTYNFIVKTGSNSSSKENKRYNDGTSIDVITKVGKKQKQILILYYD